MVRTISGILIGYAVWTALWLGGNALLFSAAGKVVQAGQRYTAVGPLIGVIALSVVCSLIAGGVAALIAKERARITVLLMSLALLATGVGVEVSDWSLMPPWYHLVFLVLIVPVCRMGRNLAIKAVVPETP